mgnify:CR=1 FL=1
MGKTIAINVNNYIFVNDSGRMAFSNAIQLGGDGIYMTEAGAFQLQSPVNLNHQIVGGTDGDFQYNVESGEEHSFQVGGSEKMQVNDGGTQFAPDTTVIIPSMTTATRVGLTPVAAMLVYDTDLRKFMVYEHDTWKELDTTAEA